MDIIDKIGNISRSGAFFDWYDFSKDFKRNNCSFIYVRRFEN